MSEQQRPALIEKLQKRKESHLERGKIYRGAFVVAGFTITLAGLAMLVLPGPAFVVIPIGLAILALEFAWAEALLERALEQADKAKQKAADATRAQKILSVIATALAIAFFAAAALVWDIPVLPV